MDFIFMEDKKITWYELSRKWFDWCFENPEKIRPTHTAMYFFIIEHCNRLGWKEKFWLPMEMTKDAIGIKNYRTYSDTLQDLIDWWFIKEIQKSKNQYSSCIIAIVENTKAHTKALDKALQKHSQKQGQSIVCIDKHINQEPNNHTTWFSLSDEIEKLISFWNEEIPKGKKITKITDDLKLWLSKIAHQFKNREEYSEAMSSTIAEYVKEIKSRDQSSSYSKHRFTLYEFLTQRNWFKKFFNQ